MITENTPLYYLLNETFWTKEEFDTIEYFLSVGLFVNFDLKSKYSFDKYKEFLYSQKAFSLSVELKERETRRNLERSKPSKFDNFITDLPKGEFVEQTDWNFVKTIEQDRLLKYINR